MVWRFGVPGQLSRQIAGSFVSFVKFWMEFSIDSDTCTAHMQTWSRIKFKHLNKSNQRHRSFRISLRSVLERPKIRYRACVSVWSAKRVRVPQKIPIIRSNTLSIEHEKTKNLILYEEAGTTRHTNAGKGTRTEQKNSDHTTRPMDARVKRGKRHSKLPWKGVLKTIIYSI